MKLVLNKANVISQKPKLLYAGYDANLSLNSARKSSFNEVMLITAGSGNVCVNSNNYPFKKGDLLIFDPQSEHYETTNNSVVVSAYFAAFENVKLVGLSPGKLLGGNDYLVIETGEYFESLCDILKMLVVEMEAKQNLYEGIGENLVKILIMLILRITNFDSSITFSKHLSYIKAKEYFDKNFTEISSIDEVCKTLYVNKFYLAHIFSEEMGIPPVKYLIQKRIELAKNLLVTTNINISEVGIECGYLDNAYFCRVFKQIEHMTPLQYRFTYKNKKI